MTAQNCHSHNTVVGVEADGADIGVYALEDQPYVSEDRPKPPK
jgi:hypothetical protein